MFSTSTEASFLFVILCLSMVQPGMSRSDKVSCVIDIEASSRQKFITRATHKNIELLYLRLLFLNESNTNLLTFDGDITTIYDPVKWVWTNDEQGKAILSLSYDYKILSCTTLSRETDTVELGILTQPPECLGRQHGHDQLTNVTKALAETAEAFSSNSLVCHRFVQDARRNIQIIYQSTFAAGLPTIKYRCCPVSKPDGDCSIAIVPSTALSFILRAIWIVSCVVAFFTPLLVKYLPSNHTETRLFNSKNTSDNIPTYELNGTGSSTDDIIPGELSAESSEFNRAIINEDEYIDLNKATPLSRLMSNSCVPLFLRVCPRLSRFVFFSILIPAVLIAALVSYSLQLKQDIQLQKQADIKTDFVQMCLNPDVFLICRVAAYILSCLILCAPGNMGEAVDESLILIGALQNEPTCCVICTAMKHTPNRELAGIQLLYDNMCRHLRYLSTFRFWKISFFVSSFPSRWLLHLFTKCESLSVAELWQSERTANDHNDGFSCWKVISVSLWLLLSPAWLTSFFICVFVIVSVMIPIGYFLACIGFVPLVFFTQKFGNSVFTWIIFFFCSSINVLSACFLIEMITFSWNFVLKLIGFTFMGLVVGIDYYIPYIVYALALFFYIQNFGRNLSDKYLKLKVLLFEECEKQQKELDKHCDDDVPVLVIKNRKTELPMIPKELFQIVCNEYMPLKKTIISSVYTLVVIIFFLTFAFASIMAFGKWAKVPSLTEAIGTAVISTLPKLLRNSGKQAGLSLFKEKKQLYSLEVTVAQFVRKQKNLQ